MYFKFDEAIANIKKLNMIYILFILTYKVIVRYNLWHLSEQRSLESVIKQLTQTKHNYYDLTLSAYILPLLYLPLSLILRWRPMHT